VICQNPVAEALYGGPKDSVANDNPDLPGEIPRQNPRETDVSYNAGIARFK